MKSTRVRLGLCWLGVSLAPLAALVLCWTPTLLRAQGQEKPREQPFVVEYYYKAKWGYAEEFLRLFRKNHMPLLREGVKAGRFVEVTAVRPLYHATEDGRWDYRVTIEYRSVADAHADPAGQEEVLRRLFPDQTLFLREEQRRFEILAAHWDVPVVPVKLD